MEAASTPTESQEKATSSGWKILPTLSRRSSTPSSSTMKATASEAMYSMRAWPKGWSASAGLPASLKPMSVMMEDPASERLLTASAVMATDPETDPARNFPAKSSALSAMPTMPDSLP